MARTKYGTLANKYVTEFDEKWMGDEKTDEQLLEDGRHSIVGRSWQQLCRRPRHAHRALRSSRHSRLIAATAAPLLPLLLTIMPLDELVMRIIKIIF